MDYFSYIKQSSETTVAFHSKAHVAYVQILLVSVFINYLSVWDWSKQLAMLLKICIKCVWATSFPYSSLEYVLKSQQDELLYL